MTGRLGRLEWASSLPLVSSISSLDVVDLINGISILTGVLLLPKKLAATNWSSSRLLHQTRSSNIRWKWRSHPSAWIAASFHGELQSRGAHQGAQGFRVPSSPWPWTAWRNVYAHCPGPSPWSVDRDGRLDLCKHVATYTCARQPAFGDWILHDRIESMTPAEPPSQCIPGASSNSRPPVDRPAPTKH